MGAGAWVAGLVALEGTLAYAVIAGAIEGLIIGAIVGGLSAAVTGGDILQGVLIGAVGGAVLGGIGGYVGGVAGTGLSGSMGMGSDAASLAAAEGGTASVSTASAAGGGSSSLLDSSTLSSLGSTALSSGISAYSASDAADEAADEASRKADKAYAFTAAQDDKKLKASIEAAKIGKSQQLASTLAKVKGDRELQRAGFAREDVKTERARRTAEALSGGRRRTVGQLAGPTGGVDYAPTIATGGISTDVGSISTDEDDFRTIS